MNYHNIIKDDLRNGPGIRVTLFVSGCNHMCPGCQNPETWDVDSGIEFDNDAKKELFEILSRDYIDGITLSGGDPLHPDNVAEIDELTSEIRARFGESKNIMLYTGYTLEQLLMCYDYLVESNRDLLPFGNAELWMEHVANIMTRLNMLVEGPFKKELLDVNYQWAGSTNQRVFLDLQKYLEEREKSNAKTQ